MTPARIMIVEDEQITATDIEDILTSLGHRVTDVVTSGEKAIERAGKNRPDLVLMDIRIHGDVDGVEAARVIRERFDIPAIFLTAHADDTTLDRAKHAEPLGYIVKPFHESELQAAIQMALYKQSKDEERKEREESLSSTLSSLGEGVIRVDDLGQVVFLNAAAEHWTGWHSAEAHGQPLGEVLRLLDKDTSAILETFTRNSFRQRSTTPLPANSCVRSRDGIERDVAGAVAPVRDPRGEPIGAVIAFGEARDHEERPSPKATPRPRRTPESEAAASDVVVASQAMHDLMRFTERIAASGVATILLQGESGVGKDVVARFLHMRSPRRDEAFIAVNCAAIPETLLESELFGYEKGAFTDARAQKKGVLDLADGGTVFLDEIGELQPHIQAKLLRVLEDQSFRRLGGIKDIYVDIRIITATNRDLATAVRNKEFREDLYYRLNVIQVSIPPIRERKDDILPLVEFFIRRYNDRFERSILGVAPEAARMLKAHNWPGNVREIRNVIERAMVLEESDYIQAENLAIGDGMFSSVGPTSTPQTPTSSGSLEDVERSMLIKALEESSGNQTQAAKVLGITRDTLRYRIKKYGLK